MAFYGTKTICLQKISIVCNLRHWLNFENFLRITVLKKSSAFSKCCSSLNQL